MQERLWSVRVGAKRLQCMACRVQCSAVRPTQDERLEFAIISSRSPSIVPHGVADQDVYLVLDDFGDRLGRAWRETHDEDTDRATLIRDLLDGQYNGPTRIVAFNSAEGWSRDVTVDVADELRRRWVELDEVPESVRIFVETVGHR